MRKFVKRAETYSDYGKIQLETQKMQLNVLETSARCEKRRKIEQFVRDSETNLDYCDCHTFRRWQFRVMRQCLRWAATRYPFAAVGESTGHSEQSNQNIKMVKDKECDEIN